LASVEYIQNFFCNLTAHGIPKTFKEYCWHTIRSWSFQVPNAVKRIFNFFLCVLRT
jgi:hypothetical protein